VFGAALDHVEEAGRAGVVPDRSEVDDHGDVLVASPGVPPDVLVDADHLDAVEPLGVIDQGALALGEDGVVGGVPRHREGLGDPGDGQVGDHQAFQRPPQRPPGQLRPRFGGLAGVLAPHVAAFGTPVAAHGDQQEGGSPAERLVGQTTDHGATRRALTATPTAPLVGVDDPAGQHRPSRFEALADDLQAELVKAGERSGRTKVAWGTSRSSRWAA